MFTKSYIKVFFVICVLFLFCGFAYFNSSLLTSNAQTGKANQQDPRIEKIAGYKTWNLVNPKPVVMDKTVAVMCAPANVSPPSPHADKYISVYVNDIGKHAMLDERIPKFPVGTIIVKEKLEKEDSKIPELLTVMIKREEGFNKENGSWEFLVFNGTATQIEKSNEASCMRCHIGYEAQDYVVRNYLTDEAKKKLK